MRHRHPTRAPHATMRSIVVAACAVVLALVARAAVAGTPPADPQKLRILPDHGTRKPELTWEDMSADETGFEMYRKEDGGAYALAGTRPASAGVGSVTWLETTALDAAKTYTYKVRAIKAGHPASGYTNESSVNFTLSWPMSVAEASIEMLHGYGDGLGLAGETLHLGVDPQANAGGQECLASICGLVFNNVGAGNNQGIWLRFLRNGATYYWHANHLSSIDAAAQVINGTPSSYKTVLGGQKVGVISAGIWSAPWSHVHIGYYQGGWTEANQLHPLTLYTSNGQRDPKQDNPSCTFAQDGGAKTLFFKRPNNTYIDYDHAEKPVYGDVDISLEVSDKMGTDPRQTADSVAYWVEGPLPAAKGKDDVKSAAHRYKLTCFSSNWPDQTNWDKLYDSAKNRKAHIPGSYPWDNYKHMLITNTKGENGAKTNIDATQLWNTNAKDDNGSVDSTHANYKGEPDTTKAHEARFPDGDYKIHVRMTDLIHTKDHTFEKIRLENFPPIVRELVVYQNSDNNESTPATGEHAGYERLIYEFKHVKPADYKVANTDLKTYQKAIVGSGNNGRWIWLKVVFSEQMDHEWGDRKIQLDPQGSGAGEAAIDFTIIGDWQKTYTDKDTFIGKLRIDPRKHATMDSKGALNTDEHSKDGDIVIKARDLRDRNNDHRGMDADSDGTPEADSTCRVHKLKIDTKHNVKPDQKPHLKVQAVSP